MKSKDRALYRLATVAGFGLASLTLLSAVLGWPLTVQYAFLALLVVVPFGLDRMATARRHR